MLSPGTVLASLYKAGVNTVDHDGIEHAGYLAFVGLFWHCFRFYLRVAYVLAERQAGTEFIRLVLAQLPPDMVKGLAPRITEINSGPPQGLLTVSILGTIWTSSSALGGYCTAPTAPTVSRPRPRISGEDCFRSCRLSFCPLSSSWR